MWHDSGTWIALGVSALFVVAGFIMHRVFVKILKTGSPEPSPPIAGSGQMPPVTNPPELPHE